MPRINRTDNIRRRDGGPSQAADAVYRARAAEEKNRNRTMRESSRNAIPDSSGLWKSEIQPNVRPKSSGPSGHSRTSNSSAYTTRRMDYLGPMIFDQYKAKRKNPGGGR